MMSKAEALTIIGDIKDHDVILVDDEVSTGGSMGQAVELLKQQWRPQYLHGLCACRADRGRQPRNWLELPVKKFITTNTIPITA